MKTTIVKPTRPARRQNRWLLLLRLLWARLWRQKGRLRDHRGQYVSMKPGSKRMRAYRASRAAQGRRWA